jgi:ribonuclease J
MNYQKYVTSLTFYGGVNEIGGNKILLEDKDTRVFLDFGKSFTRRAKFFEEYINPRVANGIEDYLTMGLLPNVKGIYRDDLMKMAQRNVMEPSVDAVLLSHAHSDHADYISFLHGKIPIYMGETCHLILQAIQERSDRQMEREILTYRERPYNRKVDPIKRKIKTFRTGDKFKIGSLEVEPIHVDHSVPGAYGFIIYTSQGPVGYTGDIRLHGTVPEMTRHFVERAKEERLIALIIEGTRIADEIREESEQLVFNESQEIVSTTNRLVLADFNFKDVDRLRTFFNIAKENDRKLVVKMNDMYFLKHLSKDPKLNVPAIDDEDVIIYLPKKGSGTYLDSDYRGRDKEFAGRHNARNAQEIAKNESKMLCALEFFSFTALIDMKPGPGATYIHSASEPYNEEQEISQERIDAWMDHFGMHKFQCHCSGHARSRDLLHIAEEINPHTLYPVHTQRPEIYKRTIKNVIEVSEGQAYSL